MSIVRIQVVALLLLCGCVTVSRAPAPVSAPAGEVSPYALPDGFDWSADDIVRYRILSKDDFQASSSGSLWGNVAHGAEICTTIVPVEDEVEGPSFRAVMRPDCSFWNKVIGPAGKIGRLAGALAGVPVIVPDKQPDWYILQHEQIHFAINEVAALQASQQLARRAPDRRRTVAPGIHLLVLEKAGTRHADFDQATSGQFDPRDLEKWVRVLESQMADYCGTGSECQVRIPG